jgi:hypothetical protein
MTIVTAHHRTGQRLREGAGTRRLAVWAICGLINLAAADTALATEDKFDGVYTGERVLTKGSKQTCPTKDDVSVTIRGGALTFTNNKRRNFPMGLHLHPDGSFRQISAGVGGNLVLTEGRIVGDVIDADVSAANCEHHWHVVRKAPPQ